MTKAPPNPLLVLAVAIALPGVGQVLNRQPTRGLIFVFFVILLGAFTLKDCGTGRVLSWGSLQAGCSSGRWRSLMPTRPRASGRRFGIMPNPRQEALSGPDPALAGVRRAFAGENSPPDVCSFLAHPWG